MSLTLILILANVLETYVSCLYSKIISSNISGYSGLIIIMCTTGGKLVGSILVSFFIYIRDSNHKLSWYLFTIIFLIVFTITYKNYKNLRVKAICRVLKKKDLN